MSKGPGKIQRAIIALFESEPQSRMTVPQIAARAYPGAFIGKSETEAVRRALQGIAPEIGLTRCRIARPDGQGWHHVYGRAA